MQRGRRFRPVPARRLPHRALPVALEGMDEAQVAAEEEKTLREYDVLKQPSAPAGFPWLATVLAVCAVLVGITTKALYALVPLGRGSGSGGIFSA